MSSASTIPAKNPRELLRQKRRFAFLRLLNHLGLSPKYDAAETDVIDNALTEFFESGFEVCERDRHLGKQ